MARYMEGVPVVWQGCDAAWVTVGAGEQRARGFLVIPLLLALCSGAGSIWPLGRLSQRIFTCLQKKHNALGQCNDLDFMG